MIITASEGRLESSGDEDSPPSVRVVQVSLDPELTAMLSWAAARSGSSGTLQWNPGGAAKGYTDIPQVEHAIAMHLFPHFQGM